MEQNIQVLKLNDQLGKWDVKCDTCPYKPKE